MRKASARQQLIAADDGFAFAEVENDVPIFDALDDAVDNLAVAVLELLELALTLGVAHLLDDDLLRGLRGDAPELERRQGLGDEVARLRGGVAAQRLDEADVLGVVLDLLDHLQEAHEIDLAGLVVDLGSNLVLGAVARAGGALDRLLHRAR